MDPSSKGQEDETPAAEATNAEGTAADAEPVRVEQLLELILDAQAERLAEEPLPPRVDGVVIGRVASIDEAGVVRVSYPGAPEGGATARVMAAVGEGDVGREAALLFEGGDRDKPVVMGLVFEGAQKPRRPPVFSRNGARATVDGERIVVSADQEIVLECGNASITLTRAGKILIKGTYVLSRSSGTNRIQGGSVQIN